MPVPPGARCCDNCNPEKFPIPDIVLQNAHSDLIRGRRKKLRPKYSAIVCHDLIAWREDLFEELYGDLGFCHTPQDVISDENLTMISEFGFPLRTIRDISE